jgi:hypothetical protein
MQAFSFDVKRIASHSMFQSLKIFRKLLAMEIFPGELQYQVDSDGITVPTINNLENLAVMATTTQTVFFD